jgi:hypothetical protein
MSKFEETKAYLASVEYYSNPGTDSKESEGIEFVIFATSYAEAEAKTIEACGEDKIKFLWGITLMEAVPLS